ncbi:hypothetical protein F2Q70_00033948 [Brassica cretica]|uniref:Arginine decarboxylase n=1 Tax=Brassica cretica TaxID=69181 RepID=A0A8S9JTK5_BRACR|nr:hypothetical protein F2Q70_00033948 [Brassica cretica]
MIVLEQEHELDLVINLSQKMNVRPLIGLRAKLRTKQSNHYGSYSGEKGKFGLTSTQIVSVVAKLSESGMLDCLQLLHFHIDSMIPSSSLLSHGVSEAAQLYCELVRLGAQMKIIDVGGGLGIDYDGSKSGEPDQSVTYTLEEYAEAVVSSISPSLSASLYRIDGWGAPYFAANSSGNISVRPHGDETLPHQDIDLMKVVKNVTVPKSSGGLGLQLPLIVRFPDVLKNRLECLQSAFDSAVKSQGYGSHYQGVFPVKCNQDRFIVEDIVNFGSPFRFGLEAGSKPEIVLAMSCLCKGNPDAFLVCNGFKDAEYVSLALLGRKLAFNTMIVLEQEHELDLVINLSQKMNVRPLIVLRAKLRTKQSNHYGSYSGEKGKFGLTSTQIVSVVAKLRESGMLDCLQLLHFHIGSMIPSSSLLSHGVSEAAQLYCELVRLGAHMKIIDVGGGLGIDYDGSKSGEPDQSVIYTLEEYAEAVVSSIRYPSNF